MSIKATHEQFDGIVLHIADKDVSLQFDHNLCAKTHAFQKIPYRSQLSIGWFLYSSVSFALTVLHPVITP